MSGELTAGANEIEVVPDDVGKDDRGEIGNAGDAHADVAQLAGVQPTIWMAQVKERLVAPPPNPNRCFQPTIFIVPDNIRSCDPAAYTPQVVSIGPYHRSTLPANDITSSLRHYKRYCVRFLLSRRCGEDEAQACWLLNECLTTLEALIGNIRSCYSSDDIGLDDHELAELMLYDGCFIIRRLLPELELQGAQSVQIHGDPEAARITITSTEGSGETRGPLLGMQWIWKLVEYDLLRLENQIPFFVVNALYQLLRTNKDEGVNLYEKALWLFGEIRPTRSKSFALKEDCKYLHLLHLFYSSLLPSDAKSKEIEIANKHVHKNNPNSLLPLDAKSKGMERASNHIHIHKNNPNSLLPLDAKSKGMERESNHIHIHKNNPNSLLHERIPCATELRRAGVSLKKNKKGGDSFLDITFECGVLQIPSLRVSDYSNFLFRNLIAFEQCFPDTMTQITTYAVFMDCLVDTAQDVNLLHLKGILVNRMSTDEEVASLLNKLTNQVHYALDRNYLHDLFIKVNRYHQSKWPRYRAGLMRDYFSNPWVIVSVVGAAILLLFTALQSFYTVYPYYIPHSKG